MSIRDCNRFDTVACTVLYICAKGSVVSINGLIENPYSILHDVYMEPDAVVMLSIAKISSDHGYVKMRLDSVEEAI